MRRNVACFLVSIAVLGCAGDGDYRQVDSEIDGEIDSEFSVINEQLEEVTPTTIQDAPGIELRDVAPANRSAVRRGEYLVELLGCGTCHTDGALTGDANPDRSLAGSRIGIAYSSPLLVARPGVVFPPNITSDIDTGIGGWSDEQLAAAIRMGEGRHSSNKFFVMPWPGYTRLSREDTYAVVRYLKSLPAIDHAVPRNVYPGEATDESYVYFGIYRSKN